MSSLTCFNDSNTNNKGEWTNCYSASNNYNFNSPAIMHDGRLWSQWQPDAAVNERIQKQEGINNNWTYRQYLQNNGLKIMNYSNSINSCFFNLETFSIPFSTAIFFSLPIGIFE